MRWLLRGRYWIVFAAMVGAGLAVAFGMMATPRYTAYTDLLIVPTNLKLATSDLYTANLQSDSQILEVESKMRMMTSGNVLRRLSSDLALQNDPEFVGKPPMIDLRRIFGLPGPNADPSASVLAALSERLKVARQERSYMVTAGVWSGDPDKSARIANGLAEAFKEELTRAEADVAGRAAKDLSGRLNELKAAAAEADAQVETFRRRHGLQQTQVGQLVNAQSMERMNSRSMDAHARLAEATSRYNELVRAPGGSASGSAALQSPTLNALRIDQATARKQVDALTLTYGDRHPSLVTARSELRSITSALDAEVNRLRRAAKVDLDEARSTLATLSVETLSLRGSVSSDDDAQVKLRELDRDAKAKTALYQAYLTRAGEAAERQRIDATDVRIISEAVAPQRRNWPPRAEIAVPAGAFAGSLLGAILIAGWGYVLSRRHLWKVA